MPTYLVTGASNGIGLATVRLLALRATSPTTVYLTARSERGLEAAESLQLELENRKGGQQPVSIVYKRLDVTDQSSIDALARDLAPTGLDVLVNNAGISWPFDVLDKETARRTIDTNYFGTLKVTTTLRPLLKTNGRVVSVSSSAGRLQAFSKPLADRIRDPSLSEEELNDLMNQFVDSVAAGTLEAQGWPGKGGYRQFRVNLPYAVSKVGCTALSKVWSRRNDGLTYVSCCPGWARTKLGGERAPIGTEEAAEVPFYLATAKVDQLVNGGFYMRGGLAEGRVGF